MESILWLVVGLIAGAALGAIAAWLIARKRGNVGKLAQLKADNERFREEVTEHFVETARLINQLTDSYKAVFDHLSSGAEKLADEKALSDRLPSVEAREVRLYRIGAVGSEAPAGDSEASPESSGTTSEDASASVSAGAPDSAAAGNEREPDTGGSVSDTGDDGEAKESSAADHDETSADSTATDKTPGTGQTAGSVASDGSDSAASGSPAHRDEDDPLKDKSATQSSETAAATSRRASAGSDDAQKGQSRGSD